jgi:hypothetical protein
MLGQRVETFAALPDVYREFFVFIGYFRVCSLLVVYDLDKGRTERQLATKYNLTRHQIRDISANRRRHRPHKVGENAPTIAQNGV